MCMLRARSNVLQFAHQGAIYLDVRQNFQNPLPLSGCVRISKTAPSAGRPNFPTSSTNENQFKDC